MRCGAQAGSGAVYGVPHGNGVGGPFCPGPTIGGAGAQAACKKLYRCWGLRRSSVRSHLEAVRPHCRVHKAAAADKAKAADNLVEYYNGHVLAHQQLWSQGAAAVGYIARVFAAAVSFAFVEPLFSIMGHRPRHWGQPHQGRACNPL